jgi:nucleoprotein TPR
MLSLLQAQETSQARESLISAETSKKHLEERLEELVRRLHGSEAKLAVYERRPTAADGITQNTDNDGNEQQLESEVAELR